MILTYQPRRRRQPMAMDDDDMISKLPDEIIQHIISFLPMEEAVSTSILSKRWEFLWTSYPNLVFDLGDEEGLKFVDRALFLRESRVQKFSICFQENGCSPDVSDCVIHLRRWIPDIVRLHVEDLHLDLSHDFDESFEFPHCLFNCASLTSFSLDHPWGDFRFPSSTNLSNLKNLFLEYANFMDVDSVDNLFNGCPMLETTSLIECSFLCNSRISAPKLYKFVLVEPQGRSSWHLPTYNVMIFAPSLKSFHLDWDFLNSYFLYDQPSLEEAKIVIDYGQSSLDDESERERFICSFYKLLKGLPLVKNLYLSSEALETLGYQGNLPVEVPFFSNLSTLSFQGCVTIGLDLGNSDDNAYHGDEYTGLMKILQNSPCLETLRFERGIILSADYEEYERTLNLVPPCYLSSLKTLEILFFKDGDYPKLFMNSAKIFLERASVLEKFILYPHKFSRVSPMEKENLIKCLNELPRASKDCQFEFSDFEMKPI